MAGSRRVRIVPIGIPDAFAAVLSEVVREKYDGSWSAAAKDADVSRGTLQRLANCVRGGCHITTLGKIRRIVPHGQRNRFDSALLGLDAGQGLQQYDRWLQHQFAHELRAVPMVKIQTPNVQVKRKLSDEALVELLRSAVVVDGTNRYRTRRERLRSVLPELRSRFPRLFGDFDEFLKESYHFKDRCELALQRVVEPLVEAEDAGYIERSWREMESGELETFLKARMKSECILLNRSPDVQRAQEIAREDNRTIRNTRGS